MIAFIAEGVFVPYGDLQNEIICRGARLESLVEGMGIPNRIGKILHGTQLCQRNSIAGEDPKRQAIWGASVQGAGRLSLSGKAALLIPG